jgi:hypothetical protein
MTAIKADIYRCQSIIPRSFLCLAPIFFRPLLRLARFATAFEVGFILIGGQDINSLTRDLDWRGDDVRRHAGYAALQSDGCDQDQEQAHSETLQKLSTF